MDSDLRRYVAPAIRYFETKKFQIVDVEKVVINKTKGMQELAMQSENLCGKPFILDWKSRKFGNEKSPYSGQPEQVSAYGAGYYGEEAIKNHEIWGINVFISTDQFTESGESKIALPATIQKKWLITTKPSAMSANYGGDQKLRSRKECAK